MLRTAAALLFLHVVLATNALDSSESDSCQQTEVEGSSMLQLARVSERAPANDASEFAPLLIDEDGVMNKYWLTNPDGSAKIIDDGMTVEFTPPHRFYLMRMPTQDFSKEENYYKPDFMGKTFTVDFDFKADGAGCGCNYNFYLVNMPWTTEGEDQDYYCDAQCLPGKGCCAEFDMSAGNKQVLQVTNHACTGVGSYPGHPDWVCNKWGDPELKTHSSDFGPGVGRTINSNEPFTYSQKFEMVGSDFVFTTTITQGGKSIELPMGPGNEQLNVMAANIEKGMAFVTGYWFDPHMNWLDGETCGQGEEHCNQNPVYITNWRLTSNDKPVPTPPTPPVVPTPAPPPLGTVCCFGGACGHGCDQNPSFWCNSDQGTCNACGGRWC